MIKITIRDAPLDFQGGGSLKKITFTMRMKNKFTPVRGQKKKFSFVSRGIFFLKFKKKRNKKSPPAKVTKKNPPPLSDKKTKTKTKKKKEKKQKTSYPPENLILCP